MRVYDGLDWSISWKQSRSTPAASSRSLGELQTTDQVARATAFLCSDAADYMTGSVLLVDGGCSLLQFAEDDGECLEMGRARGASQRDTQEINEGTLVSCFH